MTTGKNMIKQVVLALAINALLCNFAFAASSDDPPAAAPASQDTAAKDTATSSDLIDDTPSESETEDSMSEPDDLRDFEVPAPVPATRTPTPAPEPSKTSSSTTRSMEGTRAMKVSTNSLAKWASRR